MINSEKLPYVLLTIGDLIGAVAVDHPDQSSDIVRFLHRIAFETGVEKELMKRLAR